MTTCTPSLGDGQKGKTRPVFYPLNPKEREARMQEITTTDFARFGHRERKMAEQLLRAWREQGLPQDFSPEKVTIMMNTHSGNVFLTNEEYQVAMMNGDQLESFYTDFETGEEGFKEELSEEAKTRLNLTD
jgi:hypothetical protein